MKTGQSNDCRYLFCILSSSPLLKKNISPPKKAINNDYDSPFHCVKKVFPLGIFYFSKAIGHILHS